jgi:hypothetical protein
VVGVVARNVDALVQLGEENLPGWLTGLGVPPGWQLVRLEGSNAQPARMAVCGPQLDGGWDGCETINVFGFTGSPRDDVVCGNSDCTLRDLDAVDVTTHILATPPVPGVTAVRSSGYFATAGLWVWAQYNTYVAGAEAPSQGRIVQQCLFVESSRQAALDADIAQLGDAVHRGFVSALDMR